ncbi:hypothetical protein IAD21_03669 [Abditibacteriota bacterium]|nr:hypothetical protein IAD21_03669 [Abditibacteriota bacterium]
MDSFYSLMGGVAKLSGAMSRSSINLVPENGILMGLCLLLGFGCLVTYSMLGELWMLLLGFFALLSLILLFISSLLNHTIFQAKPVQASTPSADPNFDGRVLFSGKLRLQQKTVRRFLGVPSQIALLEDGDFGFVSLIDASSTFNGFVVNELRGPWHSVPVPGSLKLQDGMFYYGFKGQPAIRLSYAEKLDRSQKRATAIVAFNSEAARESARRALTEKINSPS